jgi:hypothetical protein
LQDQEDEAQQMSAKIDSLEQSLYGQQEELLQLYRDIDEER